jgi:hypothetical protein
MSRMRRPGWVDGSEVEAALECAVEDVVDHFKAGLFPVVVGEVVVARVVAAAVFVFIFLEGGVEGGGGGFGVGL